MKKSILILLVSASSVFGIMKFPEKHLFPVELKNDSNTDARVTWYSSEDIFTRKGIRDFHLYPGQRRIVEVPILKRPAIIEVWVHGKPRPTEVYPSAGTIIINKYGTVDVRYRK